MDQDDILDELTDDSESETLTLTELDATESIVELYTEAQIESYTGSNVNLSEKCDSYEIAEYGDGMFLKLRDCFIENTAVMEFGPDSMDSWEIYMRYTTFYDLTALDNLKEQFISDIVDVQLYSLCSNDIRALSEALKRNENVTTFNLTGNELDTTGCRYLSALLRDNFGIEYLDLSRCKIDSSGAAEIAKNLELSVLKCLNLSHNKIECAGLQSILDALQMNYHLLELNLCGNGIRSEGARDIIMFLEVNQKLEKLNLSRNFLNKEEDLLPLMRTLSVLNENLQVLILQWNGISGEGCANIFKNLMIKTNGLKILDLSWNNFKNVGYILGQGLKKTTKLEHFDVSNNPFTTSDIVDLLNSIVQPTSLRSLGLTHIFADEDLKKIISNVQLQIPNFNVKIGLYTGIKIAPIDSQVLFLKRIHFLGVTKPTKKSNKVDIGHTLLSMKNEGILEPMKKNQFLSQFEKLNIKGSEGIINELAKVFKNPNKKIDVALMLDKYLEIYPDTKL